MVFGIIKRLWYSTYNPEYRIIENVKGDNTAYLTAEYRINRMRPWRCMYRADMEGKVLADVYVGLVTSDSIESFTKSAVARMNVLIVDHRKDILSKKTLSRRVIADS